MSRILLLIVFVLSIGPSTFAQVRDRPVLDSDRLRPKDTSSIRTRSLKNKEDRLKPKIQEYLLINSAYDTTYVDTTLSIQKLYKFNYLRKDNLNLLPFSNVGQTYNTLAYQFEDDLETIPLFGARARHFNYLEIQDIYYYRVPTPLTELFYKTAFEQGQLLDAMFTINTSPQLNMSIAYKGLRSLGNYQNILTSTGNFRVTANYQTKNKRYLARAHIVTQDLLNKENGGLRDEDIANFRSGDNEFLDRSVFDPNFENAENILVGKRFHLEHQYNLVHPSDSTATSQLSIGNVLSFEDKFYRYQQTAPNIPYFGEALTSSIKDKVTLENFQATGFVDFRSVKLGRLRASLDYINLNYGYNSIVNIDGENLTNRIKTDFLRVSGRYMARLGIINFKSSGNLNLSDQLTGFSLTAGIDLKIHKDIEFNASSSVVNRAPNFNTLLYHSDYVNYNWDNTDEFDNVTTTSLGAGVNWKGVMNISADYSTIENYTYFGKNEVMGIKPIQGSTVDYLKLNLHKEFKFGKFSLDNSLVYQKVLNGDDILNVPEFITRNSFYFQSEMFDKALFLQTGVTFKYFTSYNMNAYDPLLAEFYVQNEEELGSFPLLDAFISAKIRQTRLFLIAEHFNSSFTGYNYFSAPGYPYRDFSIRFGLVWNFFL